jgi:hypothetical protein
MNVDSDSDNDSDDEGSTRRQQQRKQRKEAILAGIKKRYVLVSMAKRYHSQIVSAFEVTKLGLGEDFEVMGGGIMTISKARKTIKTYGTSGGFGAPNINLVRHILQKSFPDYSLDVTVTNYIRD